MEQESLKEANKEEIATEIRFVKKINTCSPVKKLNLFRMLEEDVSLHEEKLNEIDLIQTQIISTEFKTTQEYELLRKSLTRSIKEVN